MITGMIKVHQLVTGARQFPFPVHTYTDAAPLDPLIRHFRGFLLF